MPNTVPAWTITPPEDDGNYATATKGSRIFRFPAVWLQYDFVDDSLFDAIQQHGGLGAVTSGSVTLWDGPFVESVKWSSYAHTFLVKVRGNVTKNTTYPAATDQGVQRFAALSDGKAGDWVEFGQAVPSRTSKVVKF